MSNLHKTQPGRKIMPRCIRIFASLLLGFLSMVQAHAQDKTNPQIVLQLGHPDLVQGLLKGDPDGKYKAAVSTLVLDVR
jgi:hypothetical protein